MAFRMQEREMEGIAILDLSGRLVAGSETEALRGAIEELVRQNKNRVILDLKDVPFIDSSGLGALVSAHSSFEKTGGAMKLLNLSKRNVQLLVLTKLATVFQTFDDEQAAINSFFPDRDGRKFDILEFVRSQEDEPEQSGTELPPEDESRTKKG
jgi:anti-sigma B factor antagonist